MKSVVILKKVDDLGRVTIPVDIRRQLKIDLDEKLEVFTDGTSVIYRKHNNTCTICGSNKNLHEFEGQLYCNNCIHKLSQILVR